MYVHLIVRTSSSCAPSGCHTLFPSLKLFLSSVPVFSSRPLPSPLLCRRGRVRQGLSFHQTATSSSNPSVGRSTPEPWKAARCTSASTKAWRGTTCRPCQRRWGPGRLHTMEWEEVGWDACACDCPCNLSQHLVLCSVMGWAKTIRIYWQLLHRIRYCLMSVFFLPQGACVVWWFQHTYVHTVCDMVVSVCVP